MDDRLARLLLEDNVLSIQKRDSGRIALLEKLATNPSVILQQLPVPGSIEPNNTNAIYWQNIFLYDEFAGYELSGGSYGGFFGQLGWLANLNAGITLVGASGFSDEQHYGVASITNNLVGNGYMYLNSIYSPSINLLQFIVLPSAMVDAGDGCAFGLMDLSVSFEIDGSRIGIYFWREYTETNWHAVTRDGLGVTDTDTGIAFAADTWFLFEIRQPATGTIQFFINQILVATHTTNIDAATALSPVFGMADPGSSSTVTVSLDYFAMQLVPMTQRWD